MKDKRKSYSKEDKLSLLRDYYQSGLSKKQFLQESWNISNQVIKYLAKSVCYTAVPFRNHRA